MFDYTLVKKIGHGLTCECFSTTNPNIVIKVVKQSYLESGEHRIKLLLREVNIHRRVIHPNIVKLIYYTHDDESHHLILEKCDDNLRHLKKTQSMTLPTIKNIMGQLLKAVSYIHLIGMYHRDIKLENIFYKIREGEPIIKLGDFGSANYVTGKSKGLVGTPRYMAPEIIKNEYYTNSVDIWSCGIVMFILLVGLHAWKKNSVEETYQHVKTIDTNILWDFVEDELKKGTDLYMGMFDLKSVEVAKRMITHSDNRLPANELMKLDWFSKSN